MKIKKVEIELINPYSGMNEEVLNRIRNRNVSPKKLEKGGMISRGRSIIQYQSGGHLSKSDIEKRLALENKLRNQKFFNTREEISKYTPKSGDLERMGKNEKEYKVEQNKFLNKLAKNKHVIKGGENLTDAANFYTDVAAVVGTASGIGSIGINTLRLGAAQLEKAIGRNLIAKGIKKFNNVVNPYINKVDDIATYVQGDAIGIMGNSLNKKNYNPSVNLNTANNTLTGVKRNLTNSSVESADLTLGNNNLGEVTNPYSEAPFARVRIGNKDIFVNEHGEELSSIERFPEIDAKRNIKYFTDSKPVYRKTIPNPDYTDRGNAFLNARVGEGRPGFGIMKPGVEKKSKGGYFEDGGSTGKQRDDWNRFLIYLRKEGIAGDKSLDVKDKSLGLSYLDKFNTLYPDNKVDRSFIPIAQKEAKLLSQGIFPEVNERLDFPLNQYKNRTLSEEDNWLGSLTSQNTSYPRIEKKDSEGNKYDFEYDYPAYKKFLQDPKLGETYKVNNKVIAKMNRGGVFNPLDQSSFNLNNNFSKGLIFGKGVLSGISNRVEQNRQDEYKYSQNLNAISNVDTSNDYLNKGMLIAEDGLMVEDEFEPMFEYEEFNSTEEPEETHAEESLYLSEELENERNKEVEQIDNLEEPITTPNSIPINIPFTTPVESNTSSTSEGFLTYLRHQQGNAGAARIIDTAAKGLPKAGMVGKEDIDYHMRSNVGHDFKGELTPLNFLNYWKNKYKSNVVRANKISTPYDSFIEEESRKWGLNPQEVKGIIYTESAFKPNTKTGSYKGLLQLSEAEFKQKGGKDIFNPLENLRIGIQILAEKKNRK